MFGMKNTKVDDSQVNRLTRLLGVTFLPSAGSGKQCDNKDDHCCNSATQMAVSKKGGIGVRTCDDSVCMLYAAIRTYMRPY